MEKVMKLWAKISSIILIIFAIYGVYLGITFFSIVLFFLLNLSFMIIFYAPLIYFGWVKKPKSKEMKLWAKIVTFILPLLVVISFISPLSLYFPNDISFLIPAFVLIAPLYYYAWRN